MNIELSKLSDTYRDLYDADKMADNCDSKISDVSSGTPPPEAKTASMITASMLSGSSDQDKKRIY